MRSKEELKSLLTDIFADDDASVYIEVKEEERGEYTAEIIGIDGFQSYDIDSIEEDDKYYVEAWIFDCFDKKLTLHLREVEA